MINRRHGAGPIPVEPELYINEHQVHGLIILKKFGWRLVCIRRGQETLPAIVMKHRRDGAVGLLQSDGVLRISGDLRLRNNIENDVEISPAFTNEIVAMLKRYQSASNQPESLQTGF